MKVLQSRSFKKRTRRFTKKQKNTLDKQIQKILDDPNIGQEKKGDLRGVYVIKFKIETAHYLLSYRFTGDNLELIMIGPHENFYRDLKIYLKNR
jgi:mRNA-degrading endonuclease RelE of RelBE toxin-antitoxin system